MENDAPPMTQIQTQTTSTLEKLRASELHAVELEHQLALLRLTYTHTLEDLALARAECAAVRVECNELRSECSDAKSSERRVERERDEVRGKYEGLKRRLYERDKAERERVRVQAGCKRKHENEDGRERREMDMDCSSSPPTPITKLPDPNTSRLGAPIARKSSASSACSSTDERDSIWPRSPALPVPPLPLPGSSSAPSSNVNGGCVERDPRKRMKFDGHSPSSPSSPDLCSSPSLPSSSSVITSTTPRITSASSPPIPPAGLGLVGRSADRQRFPLPGAARSASGSTSTRVPSTRPTSSFAPLDVARARTTISTGPTPPASMFIPPRPHGGVR
ncbi:hypothetical protein DFH06DRAFT_572213 [Mycena polygramma]|nr:hypothetical protein DFH06DRAFT_572213 [Mycena polygramma]